MNMRLTVAAATATVLASIALYPLLQTGTWFWAGMGAVIVVAAIGVATRRRAIPAIACFAAAIAGLFIYLNVLFARHESWAGLIPTGAAIHHLRQLVAQATYEMSKAGPPVPSKPGIVMVTAAGIGLVAALTDVLAVRLHRPAIAGLPLLVLFCVPLTTEARPGTVGGILVFCAGVVGYLGLLSADGRHRLRLWGRLVHPWHDDDNTGPDVRPLAAAGRRIGSAAVVLALSLPLLVPGLRQHRLFPGTGGGGGGGGDHAAQISFPQPLDTLNRELRLSRPFTILNYHTNDHGLPPYLQVYVLDHLGANAWTMTAPSDLQTLKNGNLPAPPGMDPKAPVINLQDQISLSSNLHSSPDANYLPLPYAAHQLNIAGSWRADPSTLTVLTTSAQLAGLHYTVHARDPSPTPRELTAASWPDQMQADTYVPKVFKTKKLRKLAKSITKAYPTEYGKAVALQNWFTTAGGFSYNVYAVSAANTPAALTQFLTVSKKGYCQQFAFGMALLARLLGIPSRVVIGYTQGTEYKPGWWRVETSDAHAWPELYFNGYGWLRFEPTPSSTLTGGQATAFAPLYTNPTSGAGGPTTGNISSAQRGSGLPNGFSHKNTKVPGKLNQQPIGAHSGFGHHPKSSAAPIALVAIALLAVLLIAPALTRVVSRRWRWWKAHGDAAQAHVAWRELRDDLTDHRIPSRASESPRALAQRLTQSLGLAGAERAALERIARAEERASYSSSPPDSTRLRSDVAVVRRAVGRATGLRARLLALIAPTSALDPARAGMQHVLDVFGWMELATTKLLNRTFLRREKPAHA